MSPFHRHSRPRPSRPLRPGPAPTGSRQRRTKRLVVPRHRCPPPATSRATVSSTPSSLPPLPWGRRSSRSDALSPTTSPSMRKRTTHISRRSSTTMASCRARPGTTGRSTRVLRACGGLRIDTHRPQCAHAIVSASVSWACGAIRGCSRPPPPFSDGPSPTSTGLHPPPPPQPAPSTSWYLGNISLEPLSSWSSMVSAATSPPSPPLPTAPSSPEPPSPPPRRKDPPRPQCPALRHLPPSP